MSEENEINQKRLFEGFAEVNQQEKQDVIQNEDTDDGIEIVKIAEIVDNNLKFCIDKIKPVNTKYGNKFLVYIKSTKADSKVQYKFFSSGVLYSQLQTYENISGMTFFIRGIEGSGGNMYYSLARIS